MITVKNIISEYPKIDQELLPSYMKSYAFNTDVKKNINLYGKDATIDMLIDEYVNVLNEIAGKERKTSQKAMSKKPTRAGRAKKAKSQPSKNKQAKKANAKSAKMTKEKIGKNPEWLQTIRRFISMVGQKRRTDSVANFVKRLQFEFQANPKRKPTPHIKQISYILDILVKSVNANRMKEYITVSIPEYKLKALKELSNQYTIEKINHKKALAHQPLSGIEQQKK